jgi:hypothetical protein
LIQFFNNDAKLPTTTQDNQRSSIFQGLFNVFCKKAIFFCPAATHQTVAIPPHCRILPTIQAGQPNSRSLCKATMKDLRLPLVG